MGSARVSAIITTFRRPHLVGRAVASALSQSLRELEVIVVVDGPDPATLDALAAVRDARLRVHVTAAPGGQAAAINCGVALATGHWTALLDDDDEWLPEKLEVQLRAAESSPLREPFVGCFFLARSEEGDVVWPLRAPRPDEPVCEYLFCRTRLAFGEGVLPTSVLFAPTALLRRVPMTDGLERHCDLDWLVRADAQPGAGLVMPSDRVPVAVWHLGGQDRQSRVHDWRFSARWIASRRDLVTPRAYAGFLLTWASFSARSQRDVRAVGTLLADAIRNGQPGARELTAFAALWALPLGVRARLSRALGTT